MTRMKLILVASLFLGGVLSEDCSSQTGRGGARGGSRGGTSRTPSSGAGRTAGGTVNRPATPVKPKPGTKEYERKYGKGGDESSEPGGTDLEDDGMSAEDRLKVGKEFLADIEKKAGRIKDSSLKYDIMLMSSAGKVRKLEASYRSVHLGKTLRRHRVTVHELVRRRKHLREDLILHEVRGTKISAWNRISGARFTALKKPALSRKLAGSDLTLEALIPFDHTRYKVEYAGVGFRDGRRTNVFKAKPRVSGTSRMEVSWRIKERIPCRWKSFSGGKVTWGAVGSHLRIRDGIFVLERRSLEYRSGSAYAIIRVKARAINKGLRHELFDPKKELP